MKFHETSIPGAYVIEQEPRADDRGFFARRFCADEYAAQGLVSRVVQSSISYNKARGTLRGMHYQARPNAETKTVRCLAGALFDVIVDLRATSPTRLRWFGLRLAGDDGLALYVPAGCAHGFVTLEDRTSVEYLISDFYVPAAARGIRYNDPAIGIDWPLAPTVISERDRQLPAASEVADA